MIKNKLEYIVLFLFYSVTSSNNEENSNKPKFFQRFHSKTENKKPPVTVSLASLVRNDV